MSPQDDVRELVVALERAGIPVRTRNDGALEIDGRRIRVAPRSMAVVTPASVEQLAAPKGAVGVLVADRISEPARRALEERGWGWLDRRGHLRVWTEGVRIDTDIAPLVSTRPSDRYASPFASVGIEVALALLKEPDRAWSVTELATRLGRSAGGVSERLRALREAGLAARDNRPLQPELFWELVVPFHERAFGLAEFPAGDADDFAGLSWLGLPSDWVLTDTQAALLLGAPVASSGDGPPDFYVPEASIVDLAVSHFGPARSQPAATVRRARYAGIVEREPFRRTPSGFAVAHPVVVALDLAFDRSRGREIVEAWDPTGLGVARVW
jgi:hypothetical protein